MATITLETLNSDRPLIVYIDFKSPYAYIAIEASRALERKLGIRFDWRPFVLDIPSYLGSASLDESGAVAEQNRTKEQWAGVKYAYADCRRYASLYNLTIRGTVKIWDTNLVSTAMLWAAQHGDEVLHRFIDSVYRPFWKRELDIDDLSKIKNLLQVSGADGQEFFDWAQAEGFALNAKLQKDAFNAGVYGVPSYVLDDEIYFGREHLPRIAWKLKGCVGPAPDIAYSIPHTSNFALPFSNTKQILIGISNCLDSLLAISKLSNLIKGQNLKATWVRVPNKDFYTIVPAQDQSRSTRHAYLRIENNKANSRRYSPDEIIPENIADSIQAELIRHKIYLLDDGPNEVINPALPGVVVKVDDQIFIGRQHLPLLEALLSKSM